MAADDPPHVVSLVAHEVLMAASVDPTSVLDIAARSA